MNLKVDLILPSEQRSASLLNAKSFARIASIVVPAILLLFVGRAVLGMLQTANELRQLESQWNTKAPQQEEALALREKHRTHRAVLAELQGWRAASFAWSTQLDGLRVQVPSSIQIRRYRASQILQLDESAKRPVRLFTASLNGVAVGRSADDDVQMLKVRLSEAAPFKDHVQAVEVPTFGADPSETAAKWDRVFSIQMIYQPRAFE